MELHIVVLVEIKQAAKKYILMLKAKMQNLNLKMDSEFQANPHKYLLIY